MPGHDRTSTYCNSPTTVFAAIFCSENSSGHIKIMGIPTSYAIHESNYL